MRSRVRDYRSGPKVNDILSMFGKTLLVGLAACAFVLVQLHLAKTGSALINPHIPLSYGIFKDLIDIPIILLFIWGGWPAAGIAVVSVLATSNVKCAFWTIFSASILHGIFHTISSFEIITAARVASGIVTFLMIYAGSLALSIPLIWLLSILRRKF